MLGEYRREERRHAKEECKTDNSCCVKELGENGPEGCPTGSRTVKIEHKNLQVVTQNYWWKIDSNRSGGSPAIVQFETR